MVEIKIFHANLRDKSGYKKRTCTFYSLVVKKGNGVIVKFSAFLALIIKKERTNYYHLSIQVKVTIDN